MKSILQNRIMKVLLALLVCIVIYLINVHLNFLSIPQSDKDMKEYEFDIITVCTVFAGFSFSVLGLIISLSASKAMDRFKETNILLTYCNVVTDSIVMFVISTFVSIFIILTAYSSFILQICKEIKLFDIHDSMVELLYTVSIGYLIYGIILFAISVKKMVMLINKVFEEDIEKGRKKADNFLKAAQKQQDKMSKYEPDDYEKHTFKSE